MLLRFLLLLTSLSIQKNALGDNNSCFKRFFNLGDTYFKNDQFEEAKFQFEAALKCDDIKASERQLGEKLLDSVINIYTIALKRQKFVADSMRGIAEMERSKFEALAVEAKANELSLISNYQYEQKNFQEALFLAWQSLILTKRTPTTQMQVNFAKAAHSSFRQQFPHNFEAEIIAVQAVAGQKFLVQLANNNIYLFQLESGNGAPKIKAIGNATQFFTNNKDAFLLNDLKNGLTYCNNISQSEQHLSQQQSYLCHLDFSENNSEILACSRSGSAIFWDTSTDKSKSLDHKKNAVYYGEIAENGDQILTTAADGLLRIWNKKGVLIREIIPDEELHISKAIFSPEGEQIIAASIKGELLFINLLNDNQGITTAHKGNIQDLFFIDDHQFVSYGIDKQIKLWNLEKQYGKSLHQAESLISSSGQDASKKYIYFASEDGKVLLWNTLSNEKKELEIATNARLVAIEVSTDGQYILMTTDAARALLWDTQGRLLTSFSLEENAKVPTIFSSDGKFVLCVERNQLVAYPTPATALNQLNTKQVYSSSYVQEQQALYQVDKLLGKE
ncbi:MAG: WD40 repeat domain-containing protein [Bacteroidota bacterium]